jgi:hypothetical protein
LLVWQKKFLPIIKEVEKERNLGLVLVFCYSSSFGRDPKRVFISESLNKKLPAENKMAMSFSLNGLSFLCLTTNESRSQCDGRRNFIGDVSVQGFIKTSGLIGK